MPDRACRPSARVPLEDRLADAVVNLDSSRVQDLGVDPEARRCPEVRYSRWVVPGQSAQQLLVDWRSRFGVRPRDDATWGGEDDLQDDVPDP